MSDLDARIRLDRPWLDLDLAIEVPAGATAVLLGPNGAGKTTALMVIAGHIALDEGVIRLGESVLDDPGKDVFVPPSERHIGIVFQDHLLFPTMDIAENVAFGLRSRGVGRAQARSAAIQWLERLELSDLAGRKSSELSAGKAQRVALARALIIEPDLLLLDEPFAALDATGRTQVRRIISAHLEEFAGPRLVITHDPVEATLLGDEVYVVEEGKLTQRGDASALRLRPATRYVADLVGTNLLRGMAQDGRVDVDGHVLHVAEEGVRGPVSLIIHPRAVGLHVTPPTGSARNSWQTRVLVIEDLGVRVRLEVGDPLPLAAEVTPAAVADLGLAPGSPVWISVKATEITVSQS